MSHEGGAEWGPIEAALTAAFPTIATASYGTRVIGDFEGVARRAAQMGDELARPGEVINR